MARLPSALDMPVREPRGASGGIRVSAPDYSALENGANQIAGGLKAVAERDFEVDDYETKRRLVQFKLDTEMALEERKRQMPTGGDGYAAEWDKEFKKKAFEFVGKRDSNLPPHQAAKVGLALHQHYAQLQERAMRDEQAEKDRHAVLQLEETLGSTKSRVEVDPDSAAAMHAEGRQLIDMSPITPAAKDRLRRHYAKEIDKTEGLARVMKIQDAAGMEDFRAKLRLDQPDMMVDRPSYIGQKGPASLRYNNPGAMYPGKSASKFGSTETETIGGGHKIAVFPDAVAGAAAQFDLLTRQYAGKSMRDAISTWSGGNSVGTYLGVIERETGIKPDQKLTREMLADPAIAVPLAKAMAVQEAGRAYPLDDSQWAAAHRWATTGEQPSQTADVVSGQQPSADTPFKNLSLAERKALWGQAETQWKKIEKEQAAVAARAWADGVLNGQIEFNPVAKDARKLLDQRLSESQIGDKIFSGDMASLNTGVALSQKLRYAPEAVTTGIGGLVQSNDKAKRALGYSAVLSIIEKAPNALDHMPGHEQAKKDAVTFKHYFDMYGSPQKAMQRMADDVDPQKKKARAQVDKEADKFVKDDLSEDVVRKAMSRGTWTDWWSRPELGAGYEERAAITAEFKDSARREFERTGDKELAVKLAAHHMRNRFGVSDLLGRKQAMPHPPEHYWPPVNGKYEYMEKEISNIVGTYGPDAKKGTTRLTFAGMGLDGRPTYHVIWQRKDGRLEMLPSRWVPGAEQATEEDRTAWIKKREAAMAGAAQSGVDASPWLTGVP